MKWTSEALTAVIQSINHKTVEPLTEAKKRKQEIGHGFMEPRRKRESNLEIMNPERMISLSFAVSGGRPEQGQRQRALRIVGVRLASDFTGESRSQNSED